MGLIEFTRFDEEENPETLASDIVICAATSLVNRTRSPRTAGVFAG